MQLLHLNRDSAAGGAALIPVNAAPAAFGPVHSTGQPYEFCHGAGALQICNSRLRLQPAVLRVINLLVCVQGSSFCTWMVCSSTPEPSLSWPRRKREAGTAAATTTQGSKARAAAWRVARCGAGLCSTQPLQVHKVCFA